MDQIQNDILSQPEILSFEMRLMEAVHELSMKRRLLEECRLNLDGALWKQHELERMLEVECRDSQTMRLQLKAAVEAVQQYGEERVARSGELSRLRIELETAVRERDCLKDQTHTSQFENMTLSRQVEEMQGQLRCQQAFQENSFSLEAKLRTAVEEVKSEMEKLDQDHKRLERTCEAAQQLGTNLQETHVRFHDIQKKTTEQQKKYESEMVALRAEVGRLKMEKKKIPVNLCKEMTNDPETSKYLQEIKEFVGAESKGSAQLTETLQKALKAQAVLQKLVQEATEELQKKTEHISALQSSNGALNSSLNEAYGTIRSLEEQVKELLAKPASEEMGMQTDAEKVVCEARSTQTDVDIKCSDVDWSAAAKKESILPQESTHETTDGKQECETDNTF
ncbi:protein WEAK CHLOROPLAST MOVEMENT UNDER BLUE LIGHT 1-like isoform X2 [Zootermopsis nevadensis]|nr:protein WEAK CHLOROPLAST MOVEMENT UNDER BLUE LIGHT 1-like isoform X2 [Zootermopsis nevadensis]